LWQCFGCSFKQFSGGLSLRFQSIYSQFRKRFNVTY